LPVNETDRLRSLRNLKILDTLEEDSFDRITRLAAQLFHVPIALVSLVDHDRQWFKSHQGLPVRQTSREVSFCGHAILQEETLIVRDSAQDSRFADNPLVTGAPHIRFYAGHPLHAPDGARIGALCIIDAQPREFSAQDAASLVDLAAMVDRELALLALAMIDPLTRLSNRRGLTDTARHLLALCRRECRPAALVGIDLDHFKDINDRYGHAAGDRVLAGFARLLLKHFRSSDVLARLGGDEFCILAAGATEQGIQVALNRFSAGFATSALAREFPSLSWSTGIVQFEFASQMDLEQLLRIADERMYSVKAQTRRH
jgi:diguanylate cyclase (GGDEF)-like protein